MTLFNSFISSIQSGEIPANRLIKLAVKRHLTDIKASKKGLFYFDEDEASAIIEMFTIFKHTKGQFAKEPFHILPWQAFLIGSIYGWKKKSNNTRRFNRVYVEVARKNGKTELAAAVGLIEAFLNGEFGSHVYSVANNLSQASICWESAAQMAKFLRRDVDDLAALEIHESFNNRRIKLRDNNSHFSPLAAESKTLDGLNPQCSIVDEYHEAPDDRNLRVMETGTGGRTQPLVFVITTAGFNRNGPCFALRKVMADILEGKKKDESFFGIIFTLDEGDNWEDESVWIKANPSLGITPSVDFLRREYVKAKNEGETARINFLTKNLNVWTTVSATWIKDEDWMACAHPIDMAQLKGRPCYGGLDLATVRDITALVLFFPARNGDEQNVVLPFFWVPEDNADKRSREDGVPYLQWIADGLIEATPGNVTDYAYIKARVMDIAELYAPQSIAYDRFNASQLVIELTEEGISMDPFGQGFVSMSAPTKQLETMVLSKEINHGGNAVLRWMCGNINLKIDPAGNIKIDKGKSQEKVDGMVALVMSIGEWMTESRPTGPSKYETDEIAIL